MSRNDLYPFTLRAYETEHYTSSPELAKKVWSRIRPTNLSYYALSVIIDESSITIRVYDMRDAVYGGIGKEIHTQEVNRMSLNSEENNLLWKAIRERAYSLAEREYHERQEQKELDAILTIEAEMFPELH